MPPGFGRDLFRADVPISAHSLAQRRRVDGLRADQGRDEFRRARSAGDIAGALGQADQ